MEIELAQLKQAATLKQQEVEDFTKENSLMLHKKDLRLKYLKRSADDANYESVQFENQMIQLQEKAEKENRAIVSSNTLKRALNQTKITKIESLKSAQAIDTLEKELNSEIEKLNPYKLF